MDEKDYLMALKDVLKRKYSLSGEDAADMILSSYIISLSTSGYFEIWEVKCGRIT